MPPSELVYVCVFVPVRVKQACTIKSIHGGANLLFLPSIYATANTDIHGEKKQNARTQAQTHTRSHSLALFSEALCLFGNNTGEEGGNPQTPISSLILLSSHLSADASG